ncbi:hypothetical protein EW146_g10363, partial [Bondarzewia mesenterica]
MVLVDDRKYACEACIKGHRSSSCKHTDRPLFEIKKKGRPITQCEHCRELRKTKQVHVKCICETKEGTSEKPPKSGSKGSLKKVLASVAFPNGLPEALGASVAPHTSSDASLSDSDSGGHVSANASCDCKDGGDCHCCTSRSSHPKGGGQSDAGTGAPALAGVTRDINSTITHFRPVLPRPPQQTDNIDLHAPHPHYRPTHGSTYYSPYSRAYEEHFFTVDGVPSGNDSQSMTTQLNDDALNLGDDRSPLAAPTDTAQFVAQSLASWSRSDGPSPDL